MSSGLSSLSGPFPPETEEKKMRKNEINKEAGVSDAALSLPVIAIVGRPNVGKSSLFNAILRRRQAIVHFDSGVTRDRISASGVFEGRRFNLIDTGGLAMFSGEKRKVGFWDQSIEAQVEAAIESAVTILFVVDVLAGLSPLDKEIAGRLRASSKKVILVANKADNYKAEHLADEFHELGFGKIHTVSCLHRIGIEPLMADALAGVPKNTETGDESGNEPRPLRIAVLGRPNVGKSSLVNRLLNEDRVIVSDVAGTTRDAIDIPFTLKCGDEDVSAVLVDTAGLRKKSKIDEAVERYSMMRAEEALENADIVLFVIEATTLVSTSQDKTIARMIQDSGKGCIIIANKWDACSGVKQKTLVEDLRASLPKMLYAPLILLSAKSGYNLRELFEAIAELRAQMSVKVSTAMLNRILTDAQVRNVPPIIGGRPFKIYYGTMVGNCPPRFSLFVNDPKLCADNYKAYLENYMRKAFSFTGFPIRIFMKARRREDLNEILAKKKMFKRKREEEKRRNFKPVRQEDDDMDFED
ncbi:MAG TPA: ribosome biogenesis GTPase Der [Lentisphaeria bacterium]|nr:ribosome biogenesis GTPase Der [Lentisphaeria bacterium]